MEQAVQEMATGDVPDDAAPGVSDAPDGGAADAARAFALIAPHVDAGYYLTQNPDVASAAMDPADHYWRTGWREGRNPNVWFQTDDYLRANPDVRAAGVNPLWHFIIQGRREGRRLHPAGSAWREALDRVEAPPPAAGSLVPGSVVLGADALLGLLSAACRGARGVVVAISHDRYLEVPGGTQLLVADEQRKFNGDNVVYLHLSPVEPRLGLAPASPEPHWLNVILDGDVCGVATAGAVMVALGELPPSPPRVLVVHALHGHRPESLNGIARALRPRHAFFWVHDYGAACASPRLLRNDIAFCHAPLPQSLACRVCVHGEDRARHLARIRELFKVVTFHVVAPSAAALAQWQRAVALPARTLSVHPHARLDPLPPEAPVDDGPVRVAFVGQPAYHKGWGVFRELVAATRHLDCYRFHQFASQGELRPTDGVASVAAETLATNPFGMTRALAEHRIDLVLALSPWPETFGYVAHEALAAGANVVALAGTGNIADMLRRDRRGVVLDDGSALLEFFLSWAAESLARRTRDAGRQPAALVHCGSTATFGLDGKADPTTADPDLHLLVAGERLDGASRRDTWRFALPAPPRGGRRTVRLRSRHMRPLWESATGADTRRLGVAVAALAIDGKPVPSGDARRVSGWHMAESDWQWTDGNAILDVGRAGALEVTLVPIARYWTSPLFAPAMAAG